MLSADFFICVLRVHRTAFVSRVLGVMFSNRCFVFLFLAFCVQFLHFLVACLLDFQLERSPPRSLLRYLWLKTYHSQLGGPCGYKFARLCVSETCVFKYCCRRSCRCDSVLTHSMNLLFPYIFSEHFEYNFILHYILFDFIYFYNTYI